MNNDLNLPTTFKEIMKEKILTAFIGMIPEDKIEELMNKEIDAFFSSESLLTIKQTTIQVDNPSHDPKSTYYDNKKQIVVPALVFGSKMTPFRQLAWSVIYEYLKPKLTEIVNDANGKAKQELDKLLAEEYKPKTEETFKEIFTETAKSMSATMFYRTMSTSLSLSHENMKNSFLSVGIMQNPGTISTPATPII